ncbi:hypothetical protein EVAR_18727_1 [Eumeta japonica]|uniref:Uncharacterized protein n=1 Tax=Eumeta variegata TaxID=151549 RepID=A0A4C1UNX2_EUMVA|nr:hypothetical protein EVAR_18727_1 [Eumeta japonica]
MFKRHEGRAAPEWCWSSHYGLVAADIFKQYLKPSRVYSFVSAPVADTGCIAERMRTSCLKYPCQHFASSDSRQTPWRPFALWYQSGARGMLWRGDDVCDAAICSSQLPRTCRNSFQNCLYVSYIRYPSKGIKPDVLLLRHTKWSRNVDFFNFHLCLNARIKPGERPGEE